MQKIMFADNFKLTEKVKKNQKTTTRRLVPDKLILKHGVNKHTLLQKIPDLLWDSPYKIGETVAVAEPYRKCLDYIATLPEFEGYSRAELEAKFQEEAGWDNKMFVKAEYMPVRIKIIDVQIARLQEMNHEDCFKEGIVIKDKGFPISYGYEEIKDQWTTRQYWFSSPIEAFRSLFEKLSGKHTWEQNPLVYEYTFKQIEL